MNRVRIFKNVEQRISECLPPKTIKQIHALMLLNLRNVSKEDDWRNRKITDDDLCSTNDSSLDETAEEELRNIKAEQSEKPKHIVEEWFIDGNYKHKEEWDLAQTLKNEISTKKLKLRNIIEKEGNFISILNELFQQSLKSVLRAELTKVSDNKFEVLFTYNQENVIKFDVDDTNDKADAKQIACKAAIEYFKPGLVEKIDKIFSEKSVKIRELQNLNQNNLDHDQKKVNDFKDRAYEDELEKIRQSELEKQKKIEKKKNMFKLLLDDSTSNKADTEVLKKIELGTKTNSSPLEKTSNTQVTEITDKTPSDPLSKTWQLPAKKEEDPPKVSSSPSPQKKEFQLSDNWEWLTDYSEVFNWSMNKITVTKYLFEFKNKFWGSKEFTPHLKNLDTDKKIREIKKIFQKNGEIFKFDFKIKNEETLAQLKYISEDAKEHTVFACCSRDAECSKKTILKAIFTYSEVN